MIKKSVIFILSLLLLILLIYLLYPNFVFDNIKSKSHGIENDTLLIKFYLEKGDLLRGSNQDSSTFYYNKAIEKCQFLTQNNAINHLMALGYIGISALNCNMGNYTESDKNYRKALELADKTADNDIKSQAINIKGLLYFNQSKYDSAIIFYNEAILLAKIAENKKIQGKIYTNIAIVKYLQGNGMEAIESFKNTMVLAEDLHDIDLITGTYINMGLVAHNFGEYNKAIEYYEKAIINYEKIDGKDGLIICYQNLGSLFFLLGNYRQSLDMSNRSLELAEEIGDKSNTAKVHHNMAEFYSHLGDFEQAMQEYLVSIRIKEELNDKATLADSYNGLGSLYFQQNILEKAITYFENALVIYEELKLPRGKATSYSNIAHIYDTRKQFSEALKYFFKALDINLELKNNSVIADQYADIGSTYSKLKKFKLSEKYLLNALKIKNELNEKEGIAEVYLELAGSKLYEAQTAKSLGRYELLKQGESYGFKSYKMAEELKALPLMNSASFILKNIYKELKDGSSAIKYAEIYISTNDSLFNKKNSEALTYAEARWSVEKHQNKIELLENERKLQSEILKRKEKETNQQKIIIYFAFAVIILLGLLTLLSTLVSRRKRELSLQKQLNSLTVLKMQNIANRISPHFMFNTLGSIANSVEKPEITKNKINNLSMLLRNVMENIEHIAIPLVKELKIVEEFIELQKDKVAEPFHFEIQVDTKVNKEKLLPAMIIQIPVENALKHGLAPKETGPNELLVKIIKIDSGCLISISDNGIGLKNQSGKTIGTGSGLKMVMQTIQFLNLKNKNKIVFSIKDRIDGITGSTAEITIPDEYSFQT